MHIYIHDLKLTDAVAAHQHQMCCYNIATCMNVIPVVWLNCY